MMRTTVAAILLFGLVAGGCSESSIDVTAPSDTKCSVSVTDARTSFGPDGGSGQLSVTTSRECTWSAAAGAEWITLGGPTSGQGSSLVQYSIADNSEPAARRGAIEVSGERIEIRQEGAPEPPEPPEPPSDPEPPTPTPPEPEPPTSPEPEPPEPPEPEPPPPAPEPPPDCNYAIEPSSRDVAAAQTSVTVAVRTGAGCDWKATSRAGWITVVDGRSGSGPGTVTLRVEPNGGKARTGAVDVAGRAFTVRQEAAPQQPPEPEPPPPSPEPPPPSPEPPPPTPEPKPPPKPKPPQCNYEISPTTHSAPLLGGTGTVNVTTGDGCRWKATSNANWITILGERSGTGSAVITFRVRINLTLAARTGTLTIAGRTFTVNQSVL